MRQIVLDTETTGVDTRQGHRIIEIGCVELVQRRISDRQFHRYLNPGRDSDEGALRVHGLTREFLADKPPFAAIVDEFLAFVEGAELLIHNAEFDVGFIDYELSLLGPGYGRLAERCVIVDTLKLARERHPGQRNGLDALCKRYGIDNSHRSLHGALLDAQLLAEVYLAMTAGQSGFEFDASSAAHRASSIPSGPLPEIRVLRASSDEIAAHQARLEQIQQRSKSGCLWLQAVDFRAPARG